MTKITKEQIENWIGSDKTFEEAMNLLVLIVNKEYPVNTLRLDIESYNEVKT